MRILYVGIKGLPSKSGAERVVEGIVKELSDKHELTVLCNSSYVSEDSSFTGVNLVKIRTPKGKYIQPFAYFLLSSFYAIANKKKYDIVHIHNVEACFILPILKLRYKVIATSHGSAYARDKWGKAARALMRLTEYPFIRMSDVDTSVSLPLAEEYAERYGRQVHYIPNGVDAELEIDDESAAEILASVGAPERDYILFAAGRIDPTKGCHLLLEALPSLPNNIMIVIVGDTKHATGYDAKLRSLADERVIFVPFVSSKPALLGIVKRAKLFVFPSTIEAMSMMLLEVASLGVPVVWSDIPENVAVMSKHSVSFKSNDVSDLVTKLTWVLGHELEVHDYASLGQQYVNNTYKWSGIAEAYEAHYRDLFSSAQMHDARDLERQASKKCE